MEICKISDKDSVFEKFEISFVVVSWQIEGKGVNYREKCNYFYWEDVAAPGSVTAHQH